MFFFSQFFHVLTDMERTEEDRDFDRRSTRHVSNMERTEEDGQDGDFDRRSTRHEEAR